MSLCVCDLRVSASRLVYPQLRALQEKELSSTEHYKNEQHDRQFDHEAFLGQETAQEWEQLPSDEVKEKLRQVALYFVLSITSKIYLFSCIRIFNACEGNGNTGNSS